MMLTEQEATMKICPFMSAPVQRLENTLPFEGESDEGEFMFHAGCRASQCMAWRLGKLPKHLRITHEMSAEERCEIMDKDLPDPPRPEGVPESYVFMLSRKEAFWGEDDESREARRKGYCGLVGPQEGVE